MSTIDKISLAALERCNVLKITAGDDGKGTIVAIKKADAKNPFDAQKEIPVTVVGLDKGEKFFLQIDNTKEDRQYRDMVAAIHKGDEVTLEVVKDELTTESLKAAGLHADSLYVKMDRTYGKTATKSTSETLWTVQIGKGTERLCKKM